MNLWLSVSTQWRAGAMGVVGLDYAELRRQARDMDIVLTPGLWAKVRRLENFVLERQAGHADGTDPGGQEAARNAES